MNVQRVDEMRCTVVMDCLEGGAVRGAGRVPEPWIRFGTGPNAGKSSLATA
jgi:hypothetical protein